MKVLDFLISDTRKLVEFVIGSLHLFVSLHQSGTTSVLLFCFYLTN